MDKSIEISLLKVSPAGDTIDFIINCPMDYYFTHFYIEVIDSEDSTYTLDYLFKDEEGEYDTSRKHFSGSVPISLLGQDSPKMYKITLSALHDPEWDDVVDEELENCNRPKPEITAEAYISDVSQVYSCLMDDVLSLDAKCGNSDALDNLSRNYLILYAHHAALSLGYWEEALKYFKMLSKCFKTCKSKCRSVNAGCGCGSQPIVKPKKSTGCGCGKK